LSFFDWCYRKGGDTAEKLDYVPMPEKVVSLVEKAWTEQIKAAGKPVWP
jgi:phosphate transport system substrate-binding protein